MPRRRLTRAEQQAETRARVLEAAATVFARHGFHGASLAQVAEEAGFTKGAVYSNFQSKDDLFVSLLETRCQEVVAETRATLEAAGSMDQRLHQVGDHLVQGVLRDPDWMPLFIEFWSGSMRDPQLRERFAAIWDEVRSGLAQLIEEQARRDHLALPLPPTQLASAAMALVNGLTQQMLVDPDAIDPQTVGASLALLMPAASTNGRVVEESVPPAASDAVTSDDDRRTPPVKHAQEGVS